MLNTAGSSTYFAEILCGSSGHILAAYSGSIFQGDVSESRTTLNEPYEIWWNFGWLHFTSYLVKGVIPLSGLFLSATGLPKSSRTRREHGGYGKRAPGVPGN